MDQYAKMLKYPFKIKTVLVVLRQFQWDSLNIDADAACDLHYPDANISHTLHPTNPYNLTRFQLIGRAKPPVLNSGFILIIWQKVWSPLLRRVWLDSCTLEKGQSPGALFGRAAAAGR